MTSIYVPSDCTLKEAILRSNRCDTQTTIFLEKVIYDIQARRSLICVQKYLIITKPVCIIGNDSIINGGLFISDNIEGDIYLENLHISHRLGTGIIGKSSFVVKNVSIRNCEDDGILLYGPFREYNLHKCTGFKLSRHWHILRKRRKCCYWRNTY